MVYVTGDIHGELRRFDTSAIRRLRKGDTLIICGDFGFIWNGGAEEEKILRKLGNKKYNIAFVDGTHENFDLLARYPVEEWNGGKAHHISGNLYHRGEIFTLEDKKYFAFGGGESEEKQMRQEAGKWWESELPNLDEMRSAVSNLKASGMKVDYIITHEPPPRVLAQSVNPKDSTNQLLAFFEQLVKQVEYQKWFFGAIHVDRKVTAKNFAVFNEVVAVEEPISRGRKKK